MDAPFIAVVPETPIELSPLKAPPKTASLCKLSECVPPASVELNVVFDAVRVVSAPRVTAPV